MFFWNSFAFSLIQWMLAIWSLVPLPFLNPVWTSGSSRFTYCWSLACSCHMILLSHSKYTSRENHNLKRYMHPNVHWNAIYNSQDMEAPNWILLSHKNEWNSAICSNMNGLRAYHILSEVSRTAWRRKRQPTLIFLLENPMDREPGGLQSMGSQRVGHDGATNTHTHTSQTEEDKYHMISLICGTFRKYEWTYIQNRNKPIDKTNLWLPKGKGG